MASHTIPNVCVITLTHTKRSMMSSLTHILILIHFASVISLSSLIHLPHDIIMSDVQCSVQSPRHVFSWLLLFVLYDCSLPLHGIYACSSFCHDSLSCTSFFSLVISLSFVWLCWQCQAVCHVAVYSSVMVIPCFYSIGYLSRFHPLVTD
jgi:hypothetical protein